MNIYTVRDNLKNTIAGKEKLLEEYCRARDSVSDAEFADARAQDAAYFASIEFLKLNLHELRTILADVEVCCENATAASWAGSVDRQGGAFEDFETRNRDGWIEP